MKLCSERRESNLNFSLMKKKLFKVEQLRMKDAFELTVFLFIIANYFQCSLGRVRSEFSCGKNYDLKGLITGGDSLTRGDFPW